MLLLNRRTRQEIHPTVVNVRSFKLNLIFMITIVLLIKFLCFVKNKLKFRLLE